jgi:hypothetical protein
MTLKKFLLIAAFTLAALAPWACGGGNSSPTGPNMSPPGQGPQPTPTATHY